MFYQTEIMGKRFLIKDTLPKLQMGTFFRN